MLIGNLIAAQQHYAFYRVPVFIKRSNQTARVNHKSYLFNTCFCSGFPGQFFNCSNRTSTNSPGLYESMRIKQINMYVHEYFYDLLLGGRREWAYLLQDKHYKRKRLSEMPETQVLAVARTSLFRPTGCPERSRRNTKVTDFCNSFFLRGVIFLMISTGLTPA